MVEIKFEREKVNVEVLHDELKASLGQNYAGVSVGGGVVRVHLADGAKVDNVMDLAAQVVEVHKPEKLNEVQQKEKDRQAERVRLRAVPWAEWTADDRDLLLRWVAVQMGALPESEGV